MTSPAILDRLSALGDETRVRILALLERSEFTVSELCSVLQTPQPTISRHLKTLADEGWVEARAEGRNRHYRLASDLDASANGLWSIVRGELGEEGLVSRDAERARGVLEQRRLRSAQFFAAAAERWDEVRADLFGARAELAPLLGLLDRSWVVGDLGAGTGSLSEVLAPHVQSVIGVDRSEEMLGAARHRLGAFDNVELRRGDLEALPIADGELDVAILALVLHYVVDPPKVLAEVARALKPGGRLILLDMRTHERGAGYAEEMGHVWPGFDPDQIGAWLEDRAFEDVRLALLSPDPAASGPLLFLASATSMAGARP